MKRFIVPIGVLGAILVMGSLGYMLLQGWPLLDSLYMTVITVATVGYQEVHPLTSAGRVFTIFVIIAGIGALTLFIERIGRLAVEGEFKKILWRQKVEKSIQDLKSHVIICGYGKVGREVRGELAESGTPFVIVEKEDPVARELEREGIPFIQGDATLEEILLKAGIARSRALVTALDNDADNVYVCLTARSLRPDLIIVARAADDRAIKNLSQAGATRVISPAVLGGMQMAQAILRPAVVDFILLATRSGSLELQMEELRLKAPSPLIGKTLKDSELRSKYKIIAVAILKAGGATIYNPDPGAPLDDGDTLIVLGPTDSLNALAQQMNG